MRLAPHHIFSSLDPGRRKVVVAVSGGSDSLGLLLLAAEFFGDSRRLLAVTVDHGLRPEASAEARAVAALCARQGIAHRTMAWHGAKPSCGLIAAAREARYALLAEAAADAGADTILVAHTLDDQAETVAMRARRRDEGSGLAGMAAATLYDWRVWIVRPLLGIRRQEIRAFLAERGIGWIDDPTNRDPAYERVRVRAELSDAEIETLAARARAEGAAREALSRLAALLVERFAISPARGLYRLDPAFLAADGEAATLALRALLAMAGGASRLPDEDRVAALLARLGGDGARATLSRAVVEVRRTGIWIRREARNLPVPGAGDAPALWDGRWRIAGTGVTVAPLGAARARTFPADATQAPQSLIRAALALEPALYDAGGFVALAGDEGAAPAVAPFSRFLPGFDLALAAALAVLAGAPPLPPAPWKHHIAAEA